MLMYDIIGMGVIGLFLATEAALLIWAWKTEASNVL